MSGYAPHDPSPDSMLQTLARFYPQTQEPLFHRTYRWDHAIPIMQPGYVTALADGLRAAHEILRAAGRDGRRGE